MKLPWLIVLAFGVLSLSALGLKLPRRGHGGIRVSRKKVKKIGASITVHPPKFFHTAQFLEDYAKCSAAKDVMSIFVVFANEDNKSAFERGLDHMVPKLPRNLFTAIVPSHFPNNTIIPIKNQQIAAWKKWYGIAFMMDLGSDAPEYGLMLDSELLLYNQSDCGPTSSWYKFYDRLKALENSKTFLGARTDRRTSYQLTESKNMTGQEYDRAIIKENSRFVYLNETHNHSAPNTSVRLIEDVFDNSLFSWWTDIPYVSLTIMKRFFRAIADRPQGTIREATQGVPIPRNGNYRYWQDLSSRIMFPRFEHLSYQDFCVLHEGYRIKDVTNITNTSTWGSYNEDPKGGSRIAELYPLWISAKTYKYAQIGKIPPMSVSKPPLMIFHVDHDGNLFNMKGMQERWQTALSKTS